MHLWYIGWELYLAWKQQSRPLSKNLKCKNLTNNYSRYRKSKLILRVSSLLIEIYWFLLLRFIVYNIDSYWQFTKLYNIDFIVAWTVRIINRREFYEELKVLRGVNCCCIWLFHITCAKSAIAVYMEIDKKFFFFFFFILNK